MTARGRASAGTRPSGAAPAAGGAADETAVVLQAASLLLDHPGPSCAEDLTLVQAALAELPRSTARRRLERFLSWWCGLGDAEREQCYVATFDLDQAVTLYMTEGRPRTSRERGAALLEMRRAYGRVGAQVRRDELPDYLPLMLEVAAHVPSCRALLAAERATLEDLSATLDAGGSPFAFVVAAVLSVTPSSAGGATPTAAGDGGGRP
jgi:nitrate reductase delta subunit